MIKENSNQCDISTNNYTSKGFNFSEEFIPNQSISFGMDLEINKKNKNAVWYNSNKEKKDISLMILIYDAKNTYIGTDSRLTKEDGSYLNNFKKIYANKDKTMVVGFTGLALVDTNNETINLPKEISNLLFKGLNINEALNTMRIDDKTYLDLLDDFKLNIFIARKNESPLIVDASKDEINIKIPTKNKIYVSGDYSSNEVCKIINALLNQGWHIEDAILKTIKSISEFRNKYEVSTIGGKVQLMIV